MSHGKVVAGINRVARMTAYVKKTSRFLNGKFAPDGKVNGTDNAAASETIPLIPTQPRVVTTPQRGAGSSRAIDGNSLLRRYTAVNTQTNRARSQPKRSWTRRPT